MAAGRFTRYTLPELPYGYDDLEPYISGEIMRLHHQRHHKSYVDGANAALEKLEKHLAGEAQYDLRAVMRDFSFNYGGHIMHSIFWPNMAPNGKGGGTPGGRVGDLIARQFGSFERFREAFTQVAVSVEGVGWGVLAVDPITGELRLLQVEKHNLLAVSGLVPVLVLDVWEHAYYLQYKNNRAEYVKAWWNVVNWDDVDRRVERALQGNPVILYWAPK